jgi:hypothetical protein
VEVVLRYHWKAGDEQDYLWKIVEMPCLPPVGTEIWLYEGDGAWGFPDVECLLWQEDFPQYYVVDLSEQNVDDTVQEFIEWMATLGWQAHSLWDELGKRT